jgi:UDP-glucuronate decarboxylase
MTRILITGGAGFVGSCLADKLAENPENMIVVVDNLRTGEIHKVPTSIHNNVQFIKCDTNDYADISAVFFAWKFDFVFHYAALVGVLRTLQNPVAVLDDIAGIENVLKLSKNTGVKRVYFSSSSEVYGEPVEFPQNEHTTPLNSRLPYAIVKNVGEAYLRSYQKEYGLEYTIFRFFNTFGPKQSRDFVISKFFRMAMQNEPITIYGDGSQTRTFCFIDDNVEACTQAFYRNEYVNDVVNVGGTIEIPILQVAETIIRVVGSKSEIRFLDPLEEGDMTRRKPDTTKMMKLMNRPLVTFEEGLQRIMQNTSYIL